MRSPPIRSTRASLSIIFAPTAASNPFTCRVRTRTASASTRVASTPGTIESVTVMPFDGREWEQGRAAWRDRRKAGLNRVQFAMPLRSEHNPVSCDCYVVMRWRRRRDSRLCDSCRARWRTPYVGCWLRRSERDDASNTLCRNVAQSGSTAGHERGAAPGCPRSPSDRIGGAISLVRAGEALAGEQASEPESSAGLNRAMHANRRRCCLRCSMRRGNTPWPACPKSPLFPRRNFVRVDIDCRIRRAADLGDDKLISDTTVWQRLTEFRVRDRVRVLTLWESGLSSVSLQAGKNGRPVAAMEQPTDEFRRGGTRAARPAAPGRLLRRERRERRLGIAHPLTHSSSSQPGARGEPAGKGHGLVRRARGPACPREIARRAARRFFARAPNRAALWNRISAADRARKAPAPSARTRASRRRRRARTAIVESAQGRRR